MTEADFRREILERFSETEEKPVVIAGLHLLSPRRVARVLDVSVRTIEHELEAGRLATTYIRGSRRIAVIDLIDYLAANRRLGPRPSAGSDSASGLFPT